MREAFLFLIQRRYGAHGTLALRVQGIFNQRRYVVDVDNSSGIHGRGAVSATPPKSLVKSITAVP